MDKKEKIQLIEKHSPKSPLFKDMSLAFLFGGLICAIGECLFLLFEYIGLDEKTRGTLVTVILIFAAALITALGFFDNIARYAGAGTLVPVTGFSNAVVSEAIDSASEGIILGVGAKIFTVAGPVILFGITSGVVYGIIYYAVNMIASLM